MSVAIIIVAVLVIVLAVWQTIQIQAVRKKVDAVPADGNTVMMLQNLHHRSSVNEASIQSLDARLHLSGLRGCYGPGCTGLASCLCPPAVCIGFTLTKPSQIPPSGESVHRKSAPAYS